MQEGNGRCRALIIVGITSLMLGCQVGARDRDFFGTWYVANESARRLRASPLTRDLDLASTSLQLNADGTFIGRELPELLVGNGVDISPRRFTTTGRWTLAHTDGASVVLTFAHSPVPDATPEVTFGVYRSRWDFYLYGDYHPDMPRVLMRRNH